MSVVKLQNLSFSYGSRKILEIKELNLEAGESLFLYGPSGSGKTTLLNLLLGVHEADSGSIEILGKKYESMSAREKDHFRGQCLGAIFQSFNLIPFLSVRENILLPLKMNSKRKAKVQDEEAELKLLLQHLHLEEYQHSKAEALSVGQQQRVAAARSLIGSPELIIADEPTSALDYDHKEAFIRLLMKEKERTGAALIFVSHDQSLKHLFAKEMDLRVLNLVEQKTGVWP